MKRKKRGWLTALGISALIFTCSGFTSLAAARFHATNRLETGFVDIELEEYELEGTHRVISDRKYQILPGQTVSKIPQIENLGTDAYVRVKIELPEEEQFLEEQIFGMDALWVKAGDGFYYRREPMKTAEKTDFFEGLVIPTDYPQTKEGTSFEMHLVSEAVQAKNFTPDFSKSAPWGDITIVRAEESGDGRCDRETLGEGLTLTYVDGTKGFIANADDFFANLPVLYPGDMYHDTLQISNADGKAIRLYFRQDTGAASDLLEQLRLKISIKSEQENRVIYDGLMETKDLASEILLAELSGNETAQLSFTVTMPSDLGNEYARRIEDVDWFFRVEEMKTTPGGGYRVPAVFTGDESSIGLWLLLTGFALGTLYYLIRTRKTHH